MAQPKKLTIELTEAADGEMEINLDPLPFPTALLDEVLQALGQMRQQLQPPIPLQVPATGENTPAVPGPPGWFVGDHFPLGRVLGLRHPMFGWLVFQIPDGFLTTVQRALDAIPPDKQGPAH